MTKKTIKRTGLGIILLAILLTGGFQILKIKKGEDTANIISGLIKQRLGMEVEMDTGSEYGATAVKQDVKAVFDESIKGFEEIGKSLGDAGMSNNVVTIRGVAAFDANGDGLQDLFVPHSGRPIARPVDENGVLDTEERANAKPCALFLNQGNDKAGNPIYKSVQELIAEKGNKKLVKEELLIENKYEPREHITDDPYREGRIAFGAATADFNGDGRIDLLLLNGHFGAPFSAAGTGLRIYPGANHLGRVDKDNLDYIETNLPEFLQADLEDGRKKTYAGEPEGLNILYLNKGDKDGDGIPEWENATEQAGFNSNYTSSSGTVADIDRDGDLDLYVSNFIDPDFWGFGMENFGGNRNTLWINQLSETGKFSFVESAEKWGVSGLVEQENLDASLPLPNGEILQHPNKANFNGKEVGENAGHTWASLFVDYNEDGYPDLIVANDIPNRLRIYKNNGGKSFSQIEGFDSHKRIGCWMGIAYGDLNGDNKEEFMAANCGANAFSVRNTSLFLTDKEEVNIQSVCQLNALGDKATLHNAVFAFEGEKVAEISNQINVEFNAYTAPDICNKNNVHPIAYSLYDNMGYNNTIAALEFSWNPSFFDIDNDGDLDIYTVGALNRGNDNFIGDFSGGVGRLLVNNSTPEKYDFVDRTFEYKLFDIALVDYDADPPKRPSPGTGWHKEDFVHFTDRDAYAGVGFEVSKVSEIKDIFRMHESGNGHITTDLNGDGKMDIIVPHGGGYSSISPDARNLKIDFMGKALAIPPPNKVVKAPTTFEEGATFVYINKDEKANNWVKIQLENSGKSNVFAIGAKLRINGQTERDVVLGGQTMSTTHEPLHIGLGAEELKMVEVFWPDGEREPQVFKFPKPVKNRTIVLNRGTTQMVLR